MLILNTPNEIEMLTSLANRMENKAVKVTKYRLELLSGNAREFRRRKLWDMLVMIGVLENDLNVFHTDRLIDIIQDGVKLRGFERFIVKPKIRTRLTWGDHER